MTNPTPIPFLLVAGVAVLAMGPTTASAQDYEGFRALSAGAEAHLLASTPAAGTDVPPTGSKEALSAYVAVVDWLDGLIESAAFSELPTEEQHNATVVRNRWQFHRVRQLAALGRCEDAEAVLAQLSDARLGDDALAGRLYVARMELTPCVAVREALHRSNQLALGSVELAHERVRVALVETERALWGLQRQVRMPTAPGELDPQENAELARELVGLSLRLALAGPARHERKESPVDLGPSVAARVGRAVSLGREAVERRLALGEPLNWEEDEVNGLESAAVQTRQWYGLQILIIDAVSIITFIGGTDTSSTVRLIGLLGFDFGGPVVHASHGRVGWGLISLGPRLVVPAAVAAPADSSEHWLVVGMIVFSLLDQLLLAWDEEAPSAPLQATRFHPGIHLTDETAAFVLGATW